MSIANIGTVDVEEFIAGARWQFAKTMPKWPHEYTVRDWNDAGQFEAFIHYLFHYGEYRKEYNWNRVYLDVGEYYFWTMGHPVKETTVINRARLDQPR